MTMLVVALYETVDLAKDTVKQLKDADIKRSNIDFIKNADEDHQGFFKGLFSDSNDDQAEAEKSLEKLTNMGVERHEAEGFAAGVREGCSLIIVKSDEPGKIEVARKIMDRNAIPDVAQRYGSGTPKADISEKGRISTGPKANISEKERGQRQRSGTKLRAAEEELQVGKRKVEKGGVRASTRVTETPVTKDIHLRDEKVDVQRRKVDRPAESGDHVFEEQSVEFSETHEEPMVTKSTRVTEEVIVGKEVEEHTETINETLRRQEIDIEQLRNAGDTGRYSQFKDDFDRHYETNFAGSDKEKEDYKLGYRYGMALAEHNNYRNQDWEQVEPHARKGWEARNSGTWSEFRDSIRYGWDRIRGKGRQDQPSARG